jgi:hypothetical protein
VLKRPAASSMMNAVVTLKKWGKLTCCPP